MLAKMDVINATQAVYFFLLLFNHGQVYARSHQATPPLNKFNQKPWKKSRNIPRVAGRQLELSLEDRLRVNTVAQWETVWEETAPVSRSKLMELLIDLRRTSRESSVQPTCCSGLVACFHHDLYRCFLSSFNCSASFQWRHKGANFHCSFGRECSLFPSVCPHFHLKVVTTRRSIHFLLNERHTVDNDGNCNNNILTVNDWLAAGWFYCKQL